MHYSSEAMNVVPDSRLFLETDDSPVDIEDVLRDAAKVRGVEVETLQAIVRKNIQDIFLGHKSCIFRERVVLLPPTGLK